MKPILVLILLFSIAELYAQEDDVISDDYSIIENRDILYQHKRYKVVHGAEFDYFRNLYEDDYLGDAITIGNQIYFFSQSSMKQFDNYLFGERDFRSAYLGPGNGRFNKGYVLRFKIMEDSLAYVQNVTYYGGLIENGRKPVQVGLSQIAELTGREIDKEQGICATWLDGNYRINDVYSAPYSKYSGCRYIAVFEKGKFVKLYRDLEKEAYIIPVMDVKQKPSDMKLRDYIPDSVYYQHPDQTITAEKRIVALRQLREKIEETYKNEPFLDRYCIAYLQQMELPLAESHIRKNKTYIYITSPEAFEKTKQDRRHDFLMAKGTEFQYFRQLYEDDYLGDAIMIGDQTYFFSQSSMKQFDNYMFGQDDFRLWNSYYAGRSNKGYVLQFKVAKDGLTHVKDVTYHGGIAFGGENPTFVDLSKIADLTGERIDPEQGISANWLDGNYRINDVYSDPLRKYDGHCYIAVFKKGKFVKLYRDKEKENYITPVVDLKQMPTGMVPRDYDPDYVCYQKPDGTVKTESKAVALQRLRNKIKKSYKNEPFLDKYCVENLQEMGLIFKDKVPTPSVEE